MEINTQIVNSIKTNLRNNTNNGSKEFWTKYLKNEIEFIGVGIPKIRDIVNKVINSHNTLSGNDYFYIAYDLMKSKISEDKLSSIILLQECANKINHVNLISFIDRIFTEKLIFEWNTCDWLCVRLLTPVIDSQNKDNILLILNWHKKEYLWHARASLVPFAQCVNLSKYLSILRKPMEKLIMREERFSKTAVGWILREISKFDKNYTISFIENNLLYVNNEVVNNALKYLTKEIKNKIKSRMKGNDA